MKTKLGIISVLIILVMLLSTGLVAAKPGGIPPSHADPTKIVPTDGAEPPHPFTIIDTGEARLVDGCKAVFKLNGAETVFDLRTNNAHKTAKGQLPAGMPGGEYTVFIRQPDGSEFEIGTFTVIGEPPAPQVPYIEPTEGFQGSAFTIIDPSGRMLPGDLAVFYIEGSDPTSGKPADNVIVSADGKTLTGKVSQEADPGQNYVSIRPTINDESRFGDLSFYVTV